jgi:hypothetical protein
MPLGAATVTIVFMLKIVARRCDEWLVGALTKEDLTLSSRGWFVLEFLNHLIWRFRRIPNAALKAADQPNEGCQKSDEEQGGPILL